MEVRAFRTATLGQTVERLGVPVKELRQRFERKSGFETTEVANGRRACLTKMKTGLRRAFRGTTPNGVGPCYSGVFSFRHSSALFVSNMRIRPLDATHM